MKLSSKVEGVWKAFLRLFIVERKTIYYTDLSPEQRAAFDRAFAKMDDAFRELDKAFKK